jgi:hypothetical protein
MLTDEQRAELEAFGITAVRTKLNQSHLDRGGMMHGLKSGNLRCGDVEAWLAEKIEMQESKRRAAKYALCALISVVVGIAIAFFAFWF